MQYHRAIAGATPLPMVLFQLQPALNGVIFSKEVLLKLVSIPNVVAIEASRAMPSSSWRPSGTAKDVEADQILPGTTTASGVVCARRAGERSWVQDDRARGTARDYRQIQG